ncbi:leucine-rich repeat domain-containing protein [Schlesneria paludicola]|uniref:hypothetical protein n=1 Tax=Schlesneria paludicola TaxID=360056 RepID=UPI00029ACC5C|nr:hypothetical protein [Schlesneria paludicola]
MDEKNPVVIDALDKGDPECRMTARPYWQHTWECVPGWAKIALVSLVVLFVVHVGLGIRVWYGLQDPPEVVAIKGPERHIIIPATNRDFRNPLNWFDAVPIGLRGVSAKDVTAVRLDEHATDELVGHIAKHFPNVQLLFLSRGNITARGLLCLKSCPEIYSLDVSDTDVDDGLGELLPHLPKLTELFVMNTEVGDEFAEVAAQHRQLNYCPINGTNIMPEAVASWQKVRPRTRIQTDFDRVILRGAIRWSDGEISRRFRGPCEVGRFGPEQADGSGTWSRSMIMKLGGLRADHLRWPPQEFKNEPDGNYQIRLKLGEIDAEPADFVIKDGKLSLDRLEFRMPVTRAEAERLAALADAVK